MTDNTMDALFGESQTVQASDNQLRSISQLLAEEAAANDAKETAEALLTDAKERLNDLRTRRIPDAMRDAQLTEFRGENGLKASLVFSADGALGSPKTEEEWQERERKIDLIEAHGGGEIIKMTVSVSFDRDGYESAAKLAAMINDTDLVVPHILPELKGLLEADIFAEETSINEGTRSALRWAIDFIEVGTSRRAERLRTIHHQTLKKWIKERVEVGADLPLDELGIWYGQIAKIERPRQQS